eukprot:266351-Rhodomonas_salina.1
MCIRDRYRTVLSTARCEVSTGQRVEAVVLLVPPSAPTVPHAGKGSRPERYPAIIRHISTAHRVPPHMLWQYRTPNSKRTAPRA